VFENIREDWQTHDRSWNRHGFWVMLIYRFGRWRYKIRPRLIRLPFSFLYELGKFFSVSCLGTELPAEVAVGRRFVIEHVGAIVISGDAVFGDDCTIRHGVTIGLRHKGIRSSPRIGNRVDIGAGAKLLGPITIGDDAIIGANAVVLCDVPPNSIAVGIPARILPQKTAERA
jgi:serine O-acetyltransferase